MPGELRSLAELDEVKDGEDSEDKEEVTGGRDQSDQVLEGKDQHRTDPDTGHPHTQTPSLWGAEKELSYSHSSLLSTSTSASESLSSSAVATGTSVSGAPGVSAFSFRFRGWIQVGRGSGARETTVVHGGLFTTFCWAGGARATLGAPAVSKLL